MSGKQIDIKARLKKLFMSEKESGLIDEQSNEMDTQDIGENSAEAASVDTNVSVEEDLLAKKTAEYNELNDKYLRLYSEFDNFRRRTAREKIEMIQTAGESVLKDLVPVLDDFERAISNNEKVNDEKVLKVGFSLIYNKLKKILSDKGVKEMDMGDGVFNSDMHEAITKIPAPSDELKGKIVDTVEKGYYLHDKIIRYAKVVVGE